MKAKELESLNNLSAIYMSFKICDKIIYKFLTSLSKNDLKKFLSSLSKERKKYYENLLKNEKNYSD